MRGSAVYSLGIIGGKPALGPLLVALQDGNEDVGKDAARALRKLKDPGAIEALKGHLNDKDLEMRKLSAEALGDIDRKEALRSVRAAYKYEVMPPPFREEWDVLLIFLDVEMLRPDLYTEMLARRLKKHFSVIEETYKIWRELMHDEISYSDHIVVISAPSQEGGTCPAMLFINDSLDEMVVDIRNFKKMDHASRKKLISILLRSMDEYLITPQFG